MATKGELETQVSSLQTRFGGLEKDLMQTSRGFRTELTALVELLAKTRSDLDRLRADVERVRNTVDTIKNLQANYDVKTQSY